jgi:hypothetical protein
MVHFQMQSEITPNPKLLCSDRLASARGSLPFNHRARWCTASERPCFVNNINNIKCNLPRFFVAKPPMVPHHFDQAAVGGCHLRTAGEVRWV